MHNAELYIRAQREQEDFSIRIKPYGACLAKRMDLVYSDGILSSELYDRLMRGCREAGRFTEKPNDLISVSARSHNLLLTTGGTKLSQSASVVRRWLPSAPLPAKADSAQLRNRTGPNRQITHAVMKVKTNKQRVH